MTTLSEALSAYRICAKAEGLSPKTVSWVSSSVTYFRLFLGGDPEVAQVTAHDLRRFILALQQRDRYAGHPYAHSQGQKLSPMAIQTYTRGIRSFFGYLHREGFTEANPMTGFRLPKAPVKVVPTFTGRELERLLAQPNKATAVGFRDYAVLLTLIDTGCRLSEVATLEAKDVNLEDSFLMVMGKGGRERFIPFGQKVAKALLKYKLRHRPPPLGNERFFLSRDGRPLAPGRIRSLVAEYGQKAGLRRAHPHKLRHSSSVIYLRNGGDPFSLQKKLGHSSLTMTRHYSNLADTDVKAQNLRFGVADRLKV